MTTPSGPDLPKAMRHARLTQIRRVVVASQKAELDSSSLIKGKAEGLYSIENMKSMLA